MAIHHINPTSRELPVSQSVQCHSALCLQSGHTQQHVHFAMTVFTSRIHKRSLPQALLTKREETSADTKNIDWLALLFYIRRNCVYPNVHFAAFCNNVKHTVSTQSLCIKSKGFYTLHAIYASFWCRYMPLKVATKCSREDTNATISTLS